MVCEFSWLLLGFDKNIGNLKKYQYSAVKRQGATQEIRFCKLYFIGYYRFFSYIMSMG